MIRAYSSIYLPDAKDCLSLAFDYVVHDWRIGGDAFADAFVHSGYAEAFGRGNPSVVAGMSGYELAKAVLESEGPEPTFAEQLSAEYWAGWILAHYQWWSGRRFADILRALPFSDIVSLYPTYHEMDVSRFLEDAERNIAACEMGPTRLARVRAARGLSQSALAEASGVGLRSIQMYEQRVNDIDRAQAATLFRLARTLGCRMEDLLEDPAVKL